MQRTTLLEYRNYRDLKASAVLMALAILAYVFHHPDIEPYGGTWLGYLLGGIGAVTVFWLLWYGVRKYRIPVQTERRKVRDRSASSTPHMHTQDRRAHRPQTSRRAASTRQGWLSAHVYFGLSLIIVVTLHTGFHFGWNVHTLAYIFLLLVILSGLYGVYSYIRFPRLMSENLGADTLESLLQKIAKLNDQSVMLAGQLTPEIADIVRKAARETRIGGGVFEQLWPHRSGCPTVLAVNELHALGKSLDPQQSGVHRELYAAMIRKEAFLHRARTDIYLRAKLEFWLYWHVPFAVALVAALTAHVVSIFFYW